LNGVLATTAITRTDEVQTLTLGGTSSGLFTLSFDGTPAPAPLIPKNEVQTLNVVGSDGGIIRLSYNSVIGSEATKLSFQSGISPTAEDVLGALQSIPALSGNVQVSGPSGGPFTITFGGQLTGVNVDLITASLAGGATATVATTTPGSSPTAAQLQASLS